MSLHVMIAVDYFSGQLTGELFLLCTVHIHIGQDLMILQCFSFIKIKDSEQAVNNNKLNYPRFNGIIAFVLIVPHIEADGSQPIEHFLSRLHGVCLVFNRTFLFLTY